VRTISFSGRLHARGGSNFGGLSWRRRYIACLFQNFIGLAILVVRLVHSGNVFLNSKDYENTRHCE
jgi:hypothetical protein